MYTYIPEQIELVTPVRHMEGRVPNIALLAGSGSEASVAVVKIRRTSERLFQSPYGEYIGKKFG